MESTGAIPIQTRHPSLQKEIIALCERENEEDLEPIPIKIVHGYSKDKRPDLKQFLVNLIASGDNGVPLFFQCGNGNDSDKAKFAHILSDFKKQVDFDSIFVADSAQYA